MSSNHTSQGKIIRPNVRMALEKRAGTAGLGEREKATEPIDQHRMKDATKKE